MTLGPKNLSGRNAETSDGIDFYETPAWATEALLDREDFPGPILEPCCGNGAIARELEKYYNSDHIYGSDIRTDEKVWNRAQKGLDFRDRYARDTWMDTEGIGIFNHVITNPPFYCSQDIIKSALAISKYKVAIFNKLVLLESSRRYEFFKTTPLRTVYVFSRRVNLYRDGHPIPANSGTMAFAWFVWEHGYEGKPYIDWIK